jgi:hypothetical protein
MNGWKEGKEWKGKLLQEKNVILSKVDPDVDLLYVGEYLKAAILKKKVTPELEFEIAQSQNSNNMPSSYRDDIIRAVESLKTESPLLRNIWELYRSDRVHMESVAQYMLAMMGIYIVDIDVHKLFNREYEDFRARVTELAPAAVDEKLVVGLAFLHNYATHSARVRALGTKMESAAAGNTRVARARVTEMALTATHSARVRALGTKMVLVATGNTLVARSRVTEMALTAAGTIRDGAEARARVLGTEMVLAAAGTIRDDAEARARALFTRMALGVTDTIRDVRARVTERVTGVADTIRDGAGRVTERVTGVADTIRDGAGRVMERVRRGTPNVTEEVGAWAKNNITDLVGSVNDDTLTTIDDNGLKSLYWAVIIAIPGLMNDLLLDKKYDGGFSTATYEAVSGSNVKDSRTALYEKMNDKSVDVGVFLNAISALFILTTHKLIGFHQDTLFSNHTYDDSRLYSLDVVLNYFGVGILVNDELVGSSRNVVRETIKVSGTKIHITRQPFCFVDLGSYHEMFVHLKQLKTRFISHYDDTGHMSSTDGYHTREYWKRVISCAATAGEFGHVEIERYVRSVLYNDAKKRESDMILAHYENVSIVKARSYNRREELALSMSRLSITTK